MFSPQLRRFMILGGALALLVLGATLIGSAVRTTSPNFSILSISGILSKDKAPANNTDTPFMPLSTSAASDELAMKALAIAPDATPSPTVSPISSPISKLIQPITITLGEGLPASLLRSFEDVQPSDGYFLEGYFITATQSLSGTALQPGAVLQLDWNPSKGSEFFTQTFAAATRFDTINPVIDWKSLNSIWQGEALTFTSLTLLTDTLPALTQILGAPGALIEPQQTMTDLLATAWDDRTTLVLLPFDQLVPRLAVLAIEGQNPVENSNHFDPSRYPLIATVYLHRNLSATSASIIEQGALLLNQIAHSNRDPTRLTTVTMTGVTAMSRMMGGQMDKLGSAWPAEIVGSELASADLTIFSNEVALTPDCETNASPDSLLFCSKPEYWETLERSGADLISLTGNHVNDWGRDSLSWSLDFYAQKGVAVYGGGDNANEAVKPRIVEHNGNRLAFLGANSVGPNAAWATESLPGAARFDFAQAAQLIDQARKEDKADVIFYDMQYQESYDVWPLYDQRETFNILLHDGADVVNGVQAHVPQSMEFTDGKLILFGLGNLYFDQMWGEATRQGLIAKHTVYDGRLISTQIMVTVLFDFGQPHWATPEEREEILRRVFAASYW